MTRLCTSCKWFDVDLMFPPKDNIKLKCARGYWDGEKFCYTDDYHYRMMDLECFRHAILLALYCPDYEVEND